MTRAIRDQALEEAARGLQVIGDIVEHWLNWVKRDYGGEVVPDTHVILGYDNAPPTWPSAGQLAKWLETIRALKGTPPSPVDADCPWCAGTGRLESEQGMVIGCGDCDRTGRLPSPSPFPFPFPSPDLLKGLVEALEKAIRVVDWYAFDWHEYDEGCRARGVLPVIEAALLKVQQEKGGE